MFKLTHKYAIDRPVPDCEFIRYFPPSVNLVKGETNQISDTPRKKSAFSF